MAAHGRCKLMAASEKTEMVPGGPQGITFCRSLGGSAGGSKGRATLKT
jgi:hypothetical protein